MKRSFVQNQIIAHLGVYTTIYSNITGIRSTRTKLELIAGYALGFDREGNAAVQGTLTALRTPLHHQRLTVVIGVHGRGDHAVLARDVDRVGVTSGRGRIGETFVQRSRECTNRRTLARTGFVRLSHRVVFAESREVWLTLRALHVLIVNALRHIEYFWIRARRALVVGADEGFVS
jgi:hypothetical protein